MPSGVHCNHSNYELYALASRAISGLLWDLPKNLSLLEVVLEVLMQNVDVKPSGVIRIR